MPPKRLKTGDTENTSASQRSGKESKHTKNHSESDSDPDYEDESKDASKKRSSRALSKMVVISSGVRTRKATAATTRDDNPENKEPEYKAKYQIAREKAEKVLCTTTKNAYDKTFKVLLTEINELKDTIDCQGRKIEGLKAANFRQTENIGFDCEPDDIVQSNLQQKWADVKSWVKTYGIDGLAQTLDTSVQTKVMKRLAARADPATSTECLELARKQNLSVTTALNSLLANYIVDRFVRHQFFFLEKTTVGGLSIDLSDTIKQLYNLGCESSLERANVWLAQTMTMLQPAKSSGTSQSAQKQVSIEKRMTEAYRDITETFLSDSMIQDLMKSLIEQDAKARYQQLLDIMADFGEYFIKLGRKKVRMHAASYDIFKAEAFTRLHKAMCAHSSHSLEDDDKSLDGKRVLLVVEPAIIACGNEEGKYYDKMKVWCPATVIVEDDRRKALPVSAIVDRELLPSVATTRESAMKEDSGSDMETHMESRRSKRERKAVIDLNHSISSANQSPKCDTHRRVDSVNEICGEQQCQVNALKFNQLPDKKVVTKEADHVTDLKHIVTIESDDDKRRHSAKIAHTAQIRDEMSARVSMTGSLARRDGGFVLRGISTNLNEMTDALQSNTFGQHEHRSSQYITADDRKRKGEASVEEPDSKKAKPNDSEDQASSICQSRANTLTLNQDMVPRSENEYTQAAKTTDHEPIKGTLQQRREKGKE